MKKCRKWMAWGLVFILLAGLLGGCGKKEGQNQKTGTDMAQDGGSGSISDAESLIPVQGEMGKLSMWMVWSNLNLQNPNEMIAVQEMERVTNVHMDYYWLPMISRISFI